MYKVLMKIDGENCLYGTYKTKEEAEEISKFVQNERNVYTYIEEE